MAAFEELVASRKGWIETVLKPWCREATLADLQKAAAEWGDIAGRADPQKTLWTWAWCRFPVLVHEGLSGFDEAYELRVTLKDGKVVTGFPDARESREGRLVLLSTTPVRAGDNGSQTAGPYSIDDVRAIERVSVIAGQGHKGTKRQR